jgi:hypothetical protein
MNVTVIVPSMVMGVVLPSESPHGLPFAHESHTSHPLHHITFVCFALEVLLLFVFFSDLICYDYYFLSCSYFKL